MDVEECERIAGARPTMQYHFLVMVLAETARWSAESTAAILTLLTLYNLYGYCMLSSAQFGILSTSLCHCSEQPFFNPFMVII